MAGATRAVCRSAGRGVGGNVRFPPATSVLQALARTHRIQRPLATLVDWVADTYVSPGNTGVYGDAPGNVHTYLHPGRSRQQRRPNAHALLRHQLTSASSTARMRLSDWTLGVTSSCAEQPASPRTHAWPPNSQAQLDGRADTANVSWRRQVGVAGAEQVVKSQIFHCPTLSTTPCCKRQPRRALWPSPANLI